MDGWQKYLRTKQEQQEIEQKMKDVTIAEAFTVRNAAAAQAVAWPTTPPALASQEEEIANPALIDRKAKQRIAEAAGMNVQAVNKFLTCACQAQPRLPARPCQPRPATPLFPSVRASRVHLPLAEEACGEGKGSAQFPCRVLQHDAGGPVRGRFAPDAPHDATSEGGPPGLKPGRRPPAPHNAAAAAAAWQLARSGGAFTRLSRRPALCHRPAAAWLAPPRRPPPHRCWR